MNTKTRIALVIVLALLAGAVLVAATWAAPKNAPLAPGGSPTVVAYQGEVQVGGTPYTGNGYFKFAVVNAAGTTTYWSNDGTGTGGSEPTAAVQLAVSNGLFGVLLGDTSLGGMSQALTADVFSQPDRYLRVWFSSDNITFDQLTPDTRIAAVPYALQAQEAVDADTVDGLHASELGADYQNVVVVAKSGGDYTSVQAAIDSITDAAADNAYLVWVAPGVYSETVTMKPHVHLQGAGQEATVISSTVSGGDWPPVPATLLLASDTSLRALTVGNSGTGASNTALLAMAGMTRTLVADVTARTLGSGTNNFAIFSSGSGTGVTLRQVIALAENGSGINSGLVNFSGATAMLYGGSYTSRGGTNAWAIFSAYTATLEAESVTALAENGSDSNQGLSNYSNSTAVLYGGDYTGRGGNQAGGAGAQLNSTITAYNVTALAENGSGDVGNYAMACYDSSTATLRGGVFIARGGVNNYALSNELTVTMKAYNVTALAEDGSDSNYGFWNVDNATAVVHGASFTGRGGAFAFGISNSASGTILNAESVTALGENGITETYGLANSNGAAAVLRGGSFTARGGEIARGIVSVDSGTTLEAVGITALGEDGSNINYGLDSNAVATLSGGSFTGRGGTFTYGINSARDDTTLEADSVTALGENGSDSNVGLANDIDAEAVLHGGSFTGRGGALAYGINNSAIDTTLEADSVTALGEGGSTNNYGLNNVNGAAAALHGGSFTGRGGSVDTYGILNSGSSTTLEAANVTAAGENNSFYNFGLHNENGAEAVLRGSSFIGSGGQFAHGITNGDSSTVLKAESVTALGENSSDTSYGMLNRDSATATLDGGTFTARTAVTSTYGILNSGTMEVENVTALAENGGSNYGLHNSGGATKADNSQFTGSSNGLYLDGGTVYLGVSQLDGGATNSSGTLTCFQVYDGSYSAYTCP
jgi:hypothetical protein